ncbi:MAG: hypothetical protein R3B93_24315 [Bacteroidia bacterium]
MCLITPKLQEKTTKTYNYAPRARRLAYARMTSFYENKWFSQVKITGSYQNSLENRLIVPSGVDYEINEEDQIDTWGELKFLSNLILTGILSQE